MKPNKKRFSLTRGLAAALIVLIPSTLSVPSLLATDAIDSSTTEEAWCHLSVELPQPPSGFEAVQPHYVDASSCEVIASEVEFVPLTETEAEEQSTRREFLPSLGSEGDAVAQAASACGSMSTHNEVRDNDRFNIVINKLVTNTAWCWDGSIVTAYNTGGWYEWNRDLVGGWNPENASNALWSGCAGCNHVRVRATAEFSYQGQFDPTGTRYYNTLDSRPRVNGNGTWSCVLDVHFRNKPNDIPLVINRFTWHPSCS